jgi:hypothetical protein
MSNLPTNQQTNQQTNKKPTALLSNPTQVFVESLDKRFENVCELDLIFHVERVHHILDEIVMGGMVLETNMAEILKNVDAATALEKKEVRLQDPSLLSRSFFCPLTPHACARAHTHTHAVCSLVAWTLPGVLSRAWSHASSSVSLSRAQSLYQIACFPSPLFCFTVFGLCAHHIHRFMSFCTWLDPLLTCENTALSNGRHGFVSSAESSFALVLYERLSLSAVCAKPWPTLSRAPAISNLITHAHHTHTHTHTHTHHTHTHTHTHTHSLTHTHTNERTQLTHGAGTLLAGCRVHARQEVQRDQRNDGDQERHWCCCVQGPHLSRRSTSHHRAVSDLACCAAVSKVRT